MNPLSIPASPGSTQNGTLLVVEDDAGIRSALAMFFQLASVKAVFAETGGHALALLDTLEYAPTMILVDGRLPDMHGLELIQILRSRMSPETAIYLFSADDFTHCPISDLGISGFISKPFDAEKLLDLAQLHQNLAS